MSAMATTTRLDIMPQYSLDAIAKQGTYALNVSVSDDVFRRE